MKYAGDVADDTTKRKATSGLAVISLTPTGGIINVQASKESQLPGPSLSAHCAVSMKFIL